MKERLKISVDSKRKEILKIVYNTENSINTNNNSEFTALKLLIKK